MNIKRYLAVVLGAAILVACKESEVFYTISYPIVKIEASVTADDIEIPPATEGGKPTTEVNPIIKVIEADLLETAPVMAGGSYTLDFTKHNGGPLYVVTAPDTIPVANREITGLFVKTPASDSLQFRFARHDYICKVGKYQDQETFADKVLLTVDLTKYYQTLLPGAKIKKVLRKEYTSANSQ